MVDSKDAELKWCPMVRLENQHRPGAVTINRVPAFDEHGTLNNGCLGDRCMMWREVTRVDGYCGLAGPLTGE